MKKMISALLALQVLVGVFSNPGLAQIEMPEDAGGIEQGETVSLENAAVAGFKIVAAGNGGVVYLQSDKVPFVVIVCRHAVEDGELVFNQLEVCSRLKPPE